MLQICHLLLLGSRVPDCVFLCSCLLLPARGVEELICATAVAAGRRTCHQSTSGHLFKAKVSVYHCWRVLRSPWSPRQPEGVEHVQNLALVLELSVCPGRLAECFPAVREDFLIDLSINTCFFLLFYHCVFPAFGSWKKPKPNSCDPQKHPTESIILIPFWLEFYQVTESCFAVVQVVKENVKMGLKLHLNL